MIVIEAHELEIWDSLLHKVPVLIPSTIIHNETFYFHARGSGKRKAIILSGQIASGEIGEAAATAADMQTLRDLFDRPTFEGLDPGEREALALLNSGKLTETLFCTCDIAAIRALALMAHSESGISLENLLKRVGLQRSLAAQYTEHFSQQHLKRGK